jgi:hypothetical protein
MRKTRTLRWLIVLGMLVGMILFAVADVEAVDVNPDYVNSTESAMRIWSSFWTANTP